jgi:pimeloyl-CoA synthetase
MANLINNSPAAAGEVVWGDAMTGIKGYFATVKMSTDSVTDVGGMKELFAASSQYVESSY